MPPSLPVVSSPSCIRCWAIMRQLGAAVVDPLRKHFEKPFERARFACASRSTERVKRSASLRRVRPNMSQTRPSSASGPAATASHCATCGEDRGCPPSARPADQARIAEPQRRKDRERAAEDLPPAGAAASSRWPALAPLLIGRSRLEMSAAPLSSSSGPAAHGLRGRGSARCGLGIMEWSVYHLCPGAKAVREGHDRGEAYAIGEGAMAVGALIGAYQEDDRAGCARCCRSPAER